MHGVTIPIEKIILQKYLGNGTTTILSGIKTVSALTK
jgi:hypothetical protein